YEMRRVRPASVKPPRRNKEWDRHFAAIAGVGSAKAGADRFSLDGFESMVEAPAAAAADNPDADTAATSGEPGRRRTPPSGWLPVPAGVGGVALTAVVVGAAGIAAALLALAPDGGAERPLPVAADAWQPLPVERESIAALPPNLAP